jgi:predicted CXXCH cytochrome family protein
MRPPRHDVYRCLQAGLAALALATGAAQAHEGRVGQTKHNLAATGKAAVSGRASGELCGFCHSPHNARGKSALWAKAPAPASYRIYASSTLDAKPGQPTGTSKMCLSCHDGTIAMGTPAGSGSAGLQANPMPASSLSNLGTDLSDDHPISFAYTSGLAAQDTQLLDPSLLPDAVALDKDRNVQCTTCHDPHEDRWGSFLTKSDRNGELCITCHRLDGWLESSHQQSRAAVSGGHPAGWPYATVAENACRSCHRPHSARGHERLLILAEEEANCLLCHSGQVARADIRREIQKRSAHDPTRTLGVHDPTETSANMRRHVECSDCHNPHAASADHGRPSTYIPLGATLAQMRGLGASGVPLDKATYEYEVCFKCHGDVSGTVSGRIGRDVVTTGLRQELGAGSQSRHPILEGVAGSARTISLDPTLSRDARLRCTDCHNNDAGPRAGGVGPDGPHGSIHDVLLERNYATADATPESDQAYALCYKCHLRTSILGNESFPEHRRHIVDQKTPCAVCHDPHGVPAGSGGDHTNLINFASAVVSRAAGGSLGFRDTGQLEGNCTLRCHGREHDQQTYSHTRQPESKRNAAKTRSGNRSR